jgi:two-component system response regulator RegA
VTSTLQSFLIVDDDAVFRDRLARALRDRGFDVRTASHGADALAQCELDTPEYVVLDLRMPGAQGLDVLRAMLALDATTRIVILTGYGSVPTAIEAIRLGAVHYLQKPVTAGEVLAAFKLSTSDGAAPIDVSEVSLARSEWEHIHRVLADCDGSISEAARRLQIHRRSLQRKLQKVPPKA